LVHDQVLVEGEFDGKLVGFRAIVVNVKPAAIWLGLARPDPRLEQLTPDQPLQLTFRRDNAGMIAASWFIGHLGASRSRLFSVSWPDDPRLIQRRADLRLDTECPVEFTVLSQGETGGAGQTGEGICRNISAGGIQFTVRSELDDTVAAGDELELRIALDPGDVVLAEAVVVRVQDAATVAIGLDEQTRSENRPRSLIAVRFESISTGDQDKIVRFIFSIQRQNREGPRKTV
jgi:hypothetical protein